MSDVTRKRNDEILWEGQRHQGKLGLKQYVRHGADRMNIGIISGIGCLRKAQQGGSKPELSHSGVVYIQLN